MFTTTAVAVSVDGPYSEQGRGGDEYPVWVVCVVDDDGEAVGKLYRCLDREEAIALGERMADERRLPLDNEAGYD